MSKSRTARASRLRRSCLQRRRIEVPAGGFVAVLGPSGCGKTTLLTVLGLLRAPSRPEALAEFTLRVRGPDGADRVYDLKDDWSRGRYGRIAALRREAVGFALQTGELLPALTVRENIAAPLRLNGVAGRACRARVDELIEAFGLAAAGDRGSKIARSRINKLSGGEYQRIVLARAIAHRPALVFVDEPTSALNRELAWGALTQLRALQGRDRAHGATVMITHDEELARAFATLIIRMAPKPRQDAEGPAGEVVAITPAAPHAVGTGRGTNGRYDT
jgi:ABC-type lipoprotein export system ATPase subunit